MAIIQDEQQRTYTEPDPLAIECWAVMIYLDGTWYPYHMFKDTKEKTRRRAREYLKKVRQNTGVIVQFAMQKIWRELTEEELEKYRNGKHKFQNRIWKVSEQD